MQLPATPLCMMVALALQYRYYTTVAAATTCSLAPRWLGDTELCLQHAAQEADVQK